MRPFLPFLLLVALHTAAAGKSPLRVAVLGDSISTGAHAEPREVNGFPAVLGRTLGDSHEVRAFAISSHCLLRKADKPLVNTAVFRDAITWKPDIAFVVLGTNDSSLNATRKNWEHHPDLAADYAFLIGELRKANPEIEIHLCSPPPMVHDQPGLKPDVAADRKARAPRIHAIAKVARDVAATEPGVVFHDLTRSLRAGQTTDGVHPTNEGHAQIAARLAHVLTHMGGETSSVSPAALKKAGIESSKVSEWNSFPRVDFALPGSGAASSIIAPHAVAKGAPWIWRARFFGHQPALDLELLDRGFHLCYCDIGNLYGAPKAVERWETFHALVTGNFGLSGTPVLEGMSRGGLIIFNFASAHPDKVAAIYGDNPVCNFLSWPGGQNGKLSAADWKRCLDAYGITAAQAEDHPQPKDEATLKPIAERKIPVALVVGTADDVVPPSENAEPLAAAYEKLGAPVKVWRKPGLNHHPHGLHPPDELRDFLLQAVFR